MRRRSETAVAKQAIGIVTGFGGKRVLRLLVPSQCRFSCDGCPFGGAAAADLDALARSAASAYRSGACDTVFLTAGVPNDVTAATKRLVQLVEILRFKYAYRGYLHVKALPGAAPGLTEKLVRLVDRVSYALEAPCAAALRERGGLSEQATHALEARALAELQLARSASARTSPPLLPAAFRPVRTGVAPASQASLFDTRSSLESGSYARVAGQDEARPSRACA